MGEAISYICKKCKKENTILYGIGFLDSPSYYDNNNFKNLINRSIEENIQNIDKLKNFVTLKDVHLRDGYGNDAYICPNCKTIANKFRYELVSNNKIFIPKYKCKYCGNTLRLKKENEEFNIICVRCGSKDFEESTIYADWD